MLETHREPAAYPGFLPSSMVEEDVTALFTFGIWAHWLWQGGVFREPHLRALVEAPIAVMPVYSEVSA